MAHAIYVQVGPLANASATKIAASQKAANSGTNYIVLNGAAGTATANNICQSQTPAGATALTLNGTLATTNPVAGTGGTASAGSAVAYLGATSQRIYITGGSDESAKTFAVIGTVQSPTSFGPGAIVTETITGPNASIVSSINAYSTIISITPSGATTGAITVGTYGIATLDAARRILFTSGGNDSSITATVVGGDRNGDPITETVTLTNGSTVYTNLDFLTIASTATSGAVATTLTVGTNGVASSQWVFFDQHASNAQIAGQAVVSGVCNYTIQQTLDNPTIITNQLPTPTYQTAPASVTWFNHPDTAVVAATTSQQFNYGYAPVMARVLLNSQTNPGYVVGSFVQAFTGG